MRCVEAGCARAASWGEAGGTAARCWEHKRGSDIVSPGRRCGEAGCEQAGERGAEGRGTRWCEGHAPAEAGSLRAAPCEGCGTAAIIRQGRCAGCRPEGERGALGKERAIRELLVNAGAAFEYNVKRGRYRADFRLAGAAHDVYVEVDEGQHREYGKWEEEARMAEIGAAGGRAAVFIRYNPDGYRAAAGQAAEEGAARRARLLASVVWALATGPAAWGARVGALYLYYDGWSRRRPALRAIEAAEALSEGERIRRSGLVGEGYDDAAEQAEEARAAAAERAAVAAARAAARAAMEARVAVGAVDMGDEASAGSGTAGELELEDVRVAGVQHRRGAARAGD